jgi:hypothetical protein
MSFRFRKRLRLFPSAWVLASMFWPLPSHSQTEEKPSPSLEQRVTDLEKRLNALESIPAVAMALKFSSKSSPTASATPPPTPQENAPLELVEWTYSLRRGEYEILNKHAITYALKNRTEKAIKLLQGSIVFRDLLGEKVLGIQLLRDVKYPPRETTPMSGVWDVNSWDRAQMRLPGMNHEDVKAELTIDKVVFDDNTIWSANGH